MANRLTVKPDDILQIDTLRGDGTSHSTHIGKVLDVREVETGKGPTGQLIVGFAIEEDGPSNHVMYEHFDIGDLHRDDNGPSATIQEDRPIPGGTRHTFRINEGFVPRGTTWSKEQ